MDVARVEGLRHRCKQPLDMVQHGQRILEARVLIGVRETNAELSDTATKFIGRLFFSLPLSFDCTFWSVRWLIGDVAATDSIALSRSTSS